VPGLAQQQWIYEHTADGSARFVLGVVGQNPLVCFGINPSTAKPGALDNTVKGVAKFAANNGYDSWTMLNVYPQIATDPDEMHDQHLPELKSENERHIATAIQGRATLLAAWGTNLTIRPYLAEMLRDILKLTDAAGAKWLSIGKTTQDGHPGHPLYLARTTPLIPFDMSAYRWSRP